MDPMVKDALGAYAWMDDAACRDADPALFFPEQGDCCAEGKAICAGCPVRVPCLEYALSVVSMTGVWGGTSERERRQIRRKRAYAKGDRGRA